eukprot:scaffold14733_cov82-Attheya_sp.AAC.1
MNVACCPLSIASSTGKECGQCLMRKDRWSGWRGICWSGWEYMYTRTDKNRTIPSGVHYHWGIVNGSDFGLWVLSIDHSAHGRLRMPDGANPMPTQ